MIESIKIKKFPCWLIVDENFWVEVCETEEQVEKSTQCLNEGGTSHQVIKLERGDESMEK